MSKGTYEVEDYTTPVTAADLDGKQVWLFRLPRHVDPQALDGLRMKLPPKRGNDVAAPVLGRVTTKRGDKYCLEFGTSAESDGIRPVVSLEGDDKLSIGPAIHRVVDVRREVGGSSGEGGAAEDTDLSEAGLASLPGVVLAYSVRPQPPGLKVTFTPAGSTAVKKTKRPREEVNANETPSKKKTGSSEKKKESSKKDLKKKVKKER